MLLETRMRHGKISYQAKDVEKRVDNWKPSDQDEADQMERRESTPVAKVKFISRGYGAITCVVIDETPCWYKCCMCLVNCFRGFINCMRAAYGWLCNCCRC